MSWKDILKETITQGKVKEIEDIDIDIEDDDCNRKLQQMANKLKNYNLLLKQRWEAGWPQHQEYFEIESDKQRADYSSFEILVKEENKFTSLDQYIFEATIFKYNPIPENVACRVLEILEETPQTDKEYNSAVIFEFEGYTIYRDFNLDYQNNVNRLVVTSPNKKEEIELSWANGEDIGLVRRGGRDINLVMGSNNIYRISGYYDAREFGFSWHK